MTGYWTAEQIAMAPAGVVLSANTFNASNSATIAIGARVQTPTRLKVRTNPSISSIVNCTQPKGTSGTIMDGPVISNGYTWWNINYDTGCSGWSVQRYLVVISTAMAPQTGTAIISPSLSQAADLSATTKIQALLQQLQVLEQELRARGQ